MIDGCQAALALPGGPGTLTEVALTWNLLLTESIAPRPLILVGAGWKATLETYWQVLGEYTPPNQLCWLAFAADVETAVKLIT